MKELIKLIEQNEPFLSLPPGVHGKDHAKRVLDFALRLSEFFDADRRVIIVSALLHDVGRLNDWEDPGHGERGAVLAKEFIFKHKIDVDAELVARCIAGHVKERNKEIECRIIGDADKLDRLRFGENGPDALRTEFLELQESLAVLQYAKQVHGYC